MTLDLREPPICFACSRLRSQRTQEGLQPVCAAFPSGIPPEIFQDGYDHRLAFPGDSGIRFELLPRVSASEHLESYALGISTDDLRVLRRLKEKEYGASPLVHPLTVSD